MEILNIVGYGALILGSLIAFIGWVWLLIVGFKEGGALWGILIFLFSWMAGLVFCIMHKTGWLPFALIIVGGIIAAIGAVPIGMSMMEQMGGFPS